MIFSCRAYLFLVKSLLTSAIFVSSVSLGLIFLSFFAFLFFRVVEGSKDGGHGWHVLDEQSSERFETRFQRKTFKVNSAGFISTAFR